MDEPRASAPAMSAYGVGGPDWSPLPWAWAADRLTASRNYWLVTVSATGRPHAMPLWGVWDDDRHRFAFSCAPTARKAANLAADPRVVVAPEDAVECVSLEGTAIPVLDPDTRRRWAEMYLAKYHSAAPDLTTEFVLDNALYEVAPERVFAVIERAEEFATRATRWTFEG